MCFIGFVINELLEVLFCYDNWCLMICKVLVNIGILVVINYLWKLVVKMFFVVLNVVWGYFVRIGRI